MLGGRTISTPGAMTSRTAIPSVSISLEPTSGATRGNAEAEGGANDKSETAEQALRVAEAAMTARAAEQRAAADPPFAEVERQLRAANEASPAHQDPADHGLADQP